MKIIRWLLLAIVILLVLIFIMSRNEPVQSQEAPSQTCPADTSEGTYFSRGQDKDGNISCGFQFYNECPYASGYSADDDMCKKFEDQQKPKVKAKSVEVSNVQAQPENGK